jgi:O-antigen/teichoic acid export membrane protein
MDSTRALAKSQRTARNGLERVINSRLFSGVGANAYGQAVTLLIQFGSVPLLLSAWGVRTFGLWLVISAIPSYLALADFGFSSAAANDMTLATARGAHAQAEGAFQSVLALNVGVSFGLVAVVSAIVLLVPNRFLPQTALIGGAEVRLVWILQTLQVAATLSCGAFAGGFQSSGRYALGVFLTSSARLLESLALVAGAFLFHGFAPAAALMLATRLAALFGIAAVLLRAAPWLRLGIQHASRADIRRLISPALAVIALPAAFAVSLQGFVLVIGATLSLDAVAVFSTARTLTRSVIQAGNIVNSAIMPEVTRAFGAHDVPRLGRLIRFNLFSVVCLNGFALATLATFGSGIVAAWTRGRVAPDPVLIIGLAAVAALHSLWLSQANLVLAVNRHSRYSYWFLGVCIASVLAAIPAARALGVNGLLVPLLAGEGLMFPIVARAFRSTFGTHLAAPMLRSKGRSEPHVEAGAEK